MEFHHLCYTCHMGLIRELFIFVYEMIFVNLTVRVVTFPSNTFITVIVRNGGEATFSTFDKL